MSNAFHINTGAMGVGAYREGFKRAMDVQGQKTLAHCPYTASSTSHQLWNKGFSEGTAFYRALAA